MKQVTYEGLTFEPYISKKEIDARVGELGKEIVRDCAGKKPLFLCVLNGAFAFAGDLFRAAEEIDAESVSYACAATRAHARREQ